MSFRPSRLSFADFLAYEAMQESRHEFVDGVVVDFVAGNLRHAAVVANLIAAIRPQLPAPALVVGGDAIVPTARGARHPDLAITSADPLSAEAVVRAPTLIVEVIGVPTAVVDLTDKVDEYTAIPELREYIIVDSRKRWLQAVRREDREWRYAVPQITGALALRSLDIEIDFEAIYAGTGLTALGPSA